jgi:hypothetical protein
LTGGGEKKKERKKLWQTSSYYNTQLKGKKEKEKRAPGAINSI